MATHDTAAAKESSDELRVAVLALTRKHDDYERRLSRVETMADNIASQVGAALKSLGALDERHAKLDERHAQLDERHAKLREELPHSLASKAEQDQVEARLQLKLDRQSGEAQVRDVQSQVEALRETLSNRLEALEQHLAELHTVATSERAAFFEKIESLEGLTAMQMDVLKTQRPYREISPELLRQAKLSLETEFPNGMFEWPAIMAKWESHSGGYQELTKPSTT